MFKPVRLLLIATERYYPEALDAYSRLEVR